MADPSADCFAAPEILPKYRLLGRHAHKGRFSRRTDIKDAVDRAEIVILLVSKEFLASEFIANNELPPLIKAAKQRGKLVIPIILNHEFLPPSLGLDELQSLNPHSKPLAGMSKVGQAKVFSELAETVNTHFERRSKLG